MLFHTYVNYNLIKGVLELQVFVHTIDSRKNTRQQHSFHTSFIYPYIYTEAQYIFNKKKTTPLKMSFILVIFIISLFLLIIKIKKTIDVGNK